MGDAKGFLKVKRQAMQYRPVCERVKDYKDVSMPKEPAHSQEQASRCMDCGTPFCHWGCSAGNLIPEWNDLVFKKRWKEAFILLQSTNNFPEFTGRLCPAMCEYACVLGINDDPVTIRENELGIIEYAFDKGYVRPSPPRKRTGKKVAVIGSGPSGLASADWLNKAGHKVTVFEKDKRIGGILRYGIPDFKLEKWVIDRRLDILKKEGIIFKAGVNAGVDYSAYKLKKDFDAVCLAGGSRVPRDLKIEGRHLKGIYFAMDYLVQSNKRLAKEHIGADKIIDARGKNVVVIGGGDTGSDCVGTANRQGAKCVVQIELLERPADCRIETQPWPQYPVVLKTSSSHEEGAQRQWAVLTKRFTGEGGDVKKLSCVRVDFSKKDARGCLVMSEIASSAFDIDAGLVILAMGFVHPEHDKLLQDLKVNFDERGNVKAGPDCQTSVKGIFSAGDMRRGQSLVVWAISEGRACARSIDEYLMGKSYLI